MRSITTVADDHGSGRLSGGPSDMSENDEGKLPARSRKAVDPDAQAARATDPAVGVAQLRDLRKAIEEDSATEE